MGSPVQARTLGPESRQAPIPQPRVPATELSFRAGRASTAAGGPFPLACLNLAPPQATRPLPHPLASVWGGETTARAPALGKKGCSLVLSGRINITSTEVRTPTVWPAEWVLLRAVRVGAGRKRKDPEIKVWDSDGGELLGGL